MIFGRKKKVSSGADDPKVIEVKLSRNYRFMYENFLISTQHDLYLFLEAREGKIDALKFNFSIYKFGYPNDEALGAHPLTKYGLRFYGLFEVLNSPWIKEICNANRIHEKHDDDMFAGTKHYVVTFKDVTLDVLCNKMEETQLTREEMFELMNREIDFLKDD